MADYNINAVTRRKVFTGSAGTGPYAFTFEILVNTDIVVYFNATKLTLTTDYTVAINANGTGSVTLVVNVGGNIPATPDADDTVIVIGARDIERTTDFVTAGDLLASSLNEQLDALTIFDQQIAEENQRGMRAPPYDPALVEDGGTLDMTLPAKAERAGKYLQFNSTTGNPEAGPDSADVTALADIATDIATLADIEDGTDATDAIQTVAGISANVTTVAGISGNVTTVAGQTTNMQNITDNLSAVQNAATNAATATTKAGEAATSATASASSASSASTSATAAQTAQTAAETAETNAETAETNAETAETNAASSASASASSASSASTSAGTATTQAGIATTKAGEAATSATNAASSASSASSAQTAAESARDATLAAYDNFDDRYLGTKSSAPTVDNDGDALVAGALYFDSVAGAMYVYTGSAWVAAYVSGTGFLALTGGTMSGDLNFGDSDKAIFGAGSDLQIYHDGSNSFIDDAGTGNVFLRGSSQVITGNMTGEQAAVFNDNGAVTINYDNAQKLATTSYGIDISGSVVADTQTAGAITSSQTPDFDTYQNFVWTFTGNVTLANPTTEKTGQSGFFVFIQDGTGNHTLSLGTDYETAGGAGITLSTAASAVDVVPYIVQSSGNILLGAPQLAFS